MRPARAAIFFGTEERGHKKALDLSAGRDEGWTANNRDRGDFTPILSLARQSPGPPGPGLDERKESRSSDFGVGLLAPPYRVFSRSGFNGVFVARYSGAT